MMNKVITLAIVLRIALIAYGTWQDTHFAVKYTDIDYDVYTDAARFMIQGDSPYKRSTYRYTPLLAAILTPNILLHPAFGKILFCIADILAAQIMLSILDATFVHPKYFYLCICLWLFSPFTVSISTRGNGESLVTLMLLYMLKIILLVSSSYNTPKASAIWPRRFLALGAGAIYGVAVHWRVYPIIYALPLMRYLASHTKERMTEIAQQKAAKQFVEAAQHGSLGMSPFHQQKPKAKDSFMVAVKKIFTKDGLAFEFGALFSFLGLGYLMYLIYGDEFLRETYLYHLSRVDPRHNFSSYFYPAYIFTGINKQMLGADQSSIMQYVALKFVGDGGMIFSLVGAALQLYIGWEFHMNLPFCLFLQTFAFVVFNKVATAQYFVWHLSWLPIVLPDILESKERKRVVLPFLVWTLALGHWLAWAYQLEFGGQPVFMYVWISSLLFLGAGVWLLSQLMIIGRGTLL